MGRGKLTPISPGMQFGRLTVIKQIESDRWGNPRFECQCDCGNITQSTASNLRHGHTKCCRHCLTQRYLIAPNTRFGKLAVIKKVESDKRGNAQYKCRCDCGNLIQVIAVKLRSGHTKSCGCLQKEIAAKQAAQQSYRHGYTGTSLYICWGGMKARCLNPKNPRYKDYGGRGITIFPGWINDFPTFKKYIDQNLGPRPKGQTLDRINNDGNYEPGNLRWAPPSVQQQNKQPRLSPQIKEFIKALLADTQAIHSSWMTP